LNELITKTVHLMRFKAQEHGIVFKLELENKLELINPELINSTRNPSEIRDVIARHEATKSDIDPPLSIKADFNQMEQVLINIIKNAIEAIGQNGVITFRTTGQPLQLFIEDTGRGISKDIENQLFTPFFTTKAYGQGVGLTLIREILTAHGFDFALYTEGGNKTVFKIRF
jgi:signal transduction histidine kinase